MQHDGHQVPVTALAICRDGVVLAGEGSHVCAYDQASGLLRAKSRVFPAQAVHGIALSNQAGNHGVVWGGTLIRPFHVVEDNGEPGGILPGPILSARDWILDAVVSPSSSTVAIVTAHNTLWLLENAAEPGTTSPALHNVVAGSNCILYSAHIKWLSSSHCLLASGTAFGDIIIWSALLSVDEGRTVGCSQLHYTFPAHNGSIFGVQISSMARLPGASQDSRILATCSDDRNIKLWNISDLRSASPTLTELQRETGFGSRAAETGVAPPCVATVMGHVSRIWTLRFIDLSDQIELDAVWSFGEDATAIQWELQNSPPTAELPYTLTKRRVVDAHSGKNIWTSLMTGSSAPITGGADGAIVRYSDHANSCVVQDVSLSLPENADVVRRIKNYCFVAHETLFASTENGFLVLIDLSTSQSCSAEIISSALSGLKGYSVLQGVSGIAFAAGTDGCVYSFRHSSRQLSQIAALGTKIAGLFPCVVGPEEVALLITSVGAASAELVHVGAESIEPRKNTTLTLPQGLIVTSFVLWSVVDTELALLGSRQGSLALFMLDYRDSSPSAMPSSTIIDIGREAVTSLQHVLDPHGKHAGGYIFSTARDSSLAVHKVVVTTDGGYELVLVHQLSLPFGPNIEGLHLDHLKGRCLTWGFRSKDFVVYDAVTHREIMNVECGGAHRTWAFQPGGNEGQGTLVWTQAGTVSCKKQIRRPWEFTKPGSHGREVKAIAIAPQVQGTAARLHATGAEDTDIKISRLTTDGRDQTRLQCLQTLRKHNTGIQHLKWSCDGQILFSSGGFEEFFIWRIEHGLPYIDVGVVCASKHPRSGLSDLRVMGFHAEESERQNGVECFRIVMAYSDSTLKVWQYDLGGMWEWLQTAEYLTACLTAVIPPPIQDDQLMVDFITTSTDGHIVHWTTRHAGSLHWTDRKRVHQSSILAFATLHLPNGDMLIATGGDDNAIALTIYNARNGKLGDSLRLARAHAAAVSGLALVTTAVHDRIRLMSVGLDQRIKTWELSGGFGEAGLQGVKIKLVEDVFTAVADASGLEVWQTEDGEAGKAMVCGVGVDVWTLSAG